ncbi:hypothetical protein C8P66_13627 [Humitalea rosea]|uniref:Sodium-dependent bicarbonate transport family permease n=2 Tax=Humitalea rosea TaxID=990373 RepID=A0A2W7IJH5_9PROT|nr:hypothetical protein C8P66_13627 [Humitalea rosea]
MEAIPPPVLFFALGAFAAFIRSDLALPDAVAKGLSLYLMVAIGLHGGFALASPGAAVGVLPALALGVGMSFLLPVPAFGVLRAFTRLDRPTAAAVAGHYGSVSVVTFAAAVQAISAAGLRSEAYMPAVLAAMEAPAIISALMLAGPQPGRRSARGGKGALLKEVLAGGPVLLLLGSMAIGWAGGASAHAQLAPFAEGLFPGALCLFLLEMGLVAARQLRGAADARRRGPRAAGTLDARLVAFALLMPLFGASVGIGMASLIGVSHGGMALFGVLGASASYIAVPAAMRLALPEADAGVYVTLSVAITFPFNITLGIPLYLWAAQMLG